VSRKVYVPDRGDLVWLEFDPQTGSEQRGKRPALTLSPREYNGKVGLALFCPITSRVKGYPFEVRISGKIEGVILADQIKSLDWKSRNAQLIAKARPSVVAAALENIALLLS
jgi:mRNA interferase MazF